MEIILNNIAKRYLYDWVFRNFTGHFQAPTRYAILGSNGSGKSTFLKILSGHLSPTKGTITFKKNGQLLDKDEVYRRLSFASPYIDLIEEFTLAETVRFHQQFKPFMGNLLVDDFLETIQLQAAKHKEVRFFSSGM
ncbi:MAG: ATP-binding cassette domain-containing protein, partial [Bacteroidota bacterium]